MIENEVITLKKIDEVYFQVLCTIGQSLELKSFFECYAPNFKWHPLFRSHQWSGKISFYDMRQKILPIGLLPRFFQFCKNFRYKYILDFDVDSMSNDIEQKDLDVFYNQLFAKVKEKYYPRDYQNETILRCLRNKRGVGELGTGSGKSLIFYIIIRFLLAMNKKILLIVPTINLVEQAYSDFYDYGFDNQSQYVNKLYARYSNNFTNEKPILISTYQSLNNKSTSFFKVFDCVIIDEAHGTKADSKSVQKILKQCVNASYKFGFTGTLPDEKADILTLHGYIGPTLYSIKSSELIDRGILSHITIANIILKYPESSIKEIYNRGYDFEVNYIMEYASRNKILNFIIDNSPNNQNTLILVSRIEKHLLPVVEYLKKYYPNKKIEIIYGATDVLEREKIRGLLEREKGIILVASYKTVSTGMNIKNLHQIVFFSSYKSKITICQSIGRGLRLHNSKDKLIVYDLIDDLSYQTKKKTIHHNYMYNHWLERLKIYKKQGFSYVNKVIKL